MNKETLTKRKLAKRGNGVVITLPHSWLKEHKLGPGDKIVIIKGHNLTIIPPTKEITGLV